MLVYRICRSAFTALDGEGARRYGGRWNSPGTPVVYTAGTPSLAALELLVHLDPADAPDDLVLMTIEVPGTMEVERVDLEKLGQRWATTPAPAICQELGDAWLASGRTGALQVPAAPMPEESNLLLNPAHRDFSAVKVLAQRNLAFIGQLSRKS